MNINEHGIVDMNRYRGRGDNADNLTLILIRTRCESDKWTVTN